MYFETFSKLNNNDFKLECDHLSVQIQTFPFLPENDH